MVGKLIANCWCHEKMMKNVFVFWEHSQLHENLFAAVKMNPNRDEPTSGFLIFGISPAQQVGPAKVMPEMLQTFLSCFLSLPT